ncbi:MAG TPA: hypothetical protein PKE68_06595 [Saprospiraceae bacterium]|nr:hypothetical protein [Saprospiraceae bacterium]
MIQRKSKRTFSSFHTRYYWCLVLIGLAWACKDDPRNNAIQRLGSKNIIFLDSIQAATAIVMNDAEGFFGRITSLDMALQMKRNFPSGTSRDSILSAYRDFLARDVATFDDRETLLLTELLHDLRNRCQQIAPTLFPQKLQLLKTKANHYGPGVWYTRGSCIAIPANVLVQPDKTALREVLAHELFHIYSRYHPQQRLALYALIGFEPLSGDLRLPPPVQSRLLLNPDGAHLAYAIRLAQGQGDTIQALPILTSKAPAWIESRPAYLEYLNFNLYPVVQTPDGAWAVQADELGRSALHVNEQSDFFRQIGDNTLYIIHPDEILADNFKWLVLAQPGEGRYPLDRFSEAGRALLEQIKTILKN